ncbi:MAG: hypothetical protein JWP88_255 [Flaviaesturariibacter sp.]|nr:hypothetical protein [Flaviaesturariibacter sp.]
MQTNVWLKYVPIIRILLKKAKVGDQTLPLNVSDFERAGVARKSGYKFDIKFSKGRVDNVIIDSPLASVLSQSLLADPAIKELFQQNDFTISMNTKFVLTIAQTTANGAETAVSQEADTSA